jgi:amino acid adenylation domain-containing protein
MGYLLHHLLVESAATLPEKEAVRFEGKAMTYAQLESITNQLAGLLRRIGVRRGDRVGIYVNKSFASVVSVFGIMKAGATYVPLDPNAPAKRLAYITRNCELKVLLTSARKATELAQLFHEDTPLESLVFMDDFAAAGLAIPDGISMFTPADISAVPDSPALQDEAIETDLAYILYTSGSTGEPKGVMISHRTILTFINWCHETFHISGNDRITSHAPLHFDLSTFDIYATVKAGGTIILVPEALSVFPQKLADLLQNEKVTITYLVPSILSLMVNYGKLAGHDFTLLRAILFAGEVFPVKYLRKLAVAVPHVDYYNLYGPTETNVCTYYQVQPKDLAEGQIEPLPIGVACSNTEVFAVSDSGEIITEVNQEGELWVRGSCVAQGYWGDAAKTARGFVNNPFQSSFNEIAYRTGDIVKLDQDGVNWRFIGRRDHMIKSRGYRVELGEIEAVLYSHEVIKEAAVIAVPDELIGNRIKAFVVPVDGKRPAPQDLQEFCRQLLPRYMVPETIELHDALPKNSSGKIDRPFLAKKADTQSGLKIMDVSGDSGSDGSNYKNGGL